MMADASLFLAYEYAGHIGRPASEVLELPVAEYTTGFLAYRKTRAALMESADGA